MTPLRAAIILLLAASTQAQPLDVPPSAAELRRWASDECVSAGKHVGIDYARALDRAIAKDPTGLTTLFRFTTSDWHDGAAGENHDDIIFGLLQRWGDLDFARVLRKEPRRVRKAVIDALDYGGLQPTEFPHTYALAPHYHAPPK